MKKFILLFLAIFSSIYLFSQKEMSCCMANATEAFAQNAGNKKFTMSHDEPLPFVYESENGKDITFKATDGKDAHAWEVKAQKNTNYYLFVVHEWWGLNDYIKKEAEKFSNDLNINVIALDLYDQKVASTREDAATYMQQVTTDRAQAIIKGAYEYVGKNAKVFTIGWCFGGGWSLQTGLLGGSQVAGVIMYYGQPEKDVEKLKTLKADVIGFFGNLDQWPNPQTVNEFEANMKKAGKKLIVHRYNATHAFANPSNPKYDKEATEDAYKHVVEFITSRMK